MNKIKNSLKNQLSFINFIKIMVSGAYQIRREKFILDMKNKLTEVSHNSLGLREEELNGTIKSSILCCGGSNTWGAGVDQDKRYTDF